VLEAGCAFVNCIPVFIAREDLLGPSLQESGPADHRRRHQVAGWRDIVHRALASLFADRGVSIVHTRSSTWAATWTSSTCSSASGWSPTKISKTNAVTSVMDHELPAGFTCTSDLRNVPG